MEPGARIEAWFADHDDGEFSLATEPPRALRTATAGSEGRTLFSTKPHLPAKLLDGDSRECTLLGGYGLPRPDALEALRRHAGPRPLYFLGDLDPVDLGVFFWLRLRLAPTPVVHLGLSDRFLDRCGVDLPSSFRIACRQAERDFWPALVAQAPDLAAIVGDRGAELLSQGVKLELEALFCAATLRGLCTPQRIRDALFA